MTQAITGMRSPVLTDNLSASRTSGKGPEAGFGDTLASAMDEVEQLHTDAQQQVTQMLAGDGQDLHSAVIAVEKADIAFQLMMQVRNKIVNAYQEVSRMQF